MDIQTSILLFFSSLHTKFTVMIADVITTFGTELPLIAFLLFIYLAVDKKKGAASCLVFVIATNIMGLLKAIVRFPRPWKVISGLDSQSMKGATGYSFPSGHTTCCSSCFASLAVAFKKKWLSRLCAIIIALVGFSRMFLCVHWPLDVAGGLLVGCGSALLIVDKSIKLLDDIKKTTKIILPIGILLSVITLVMSILLYKEMIDETAFSDFSKSLASFAGMALGFTIEFNKYNFVVEKGCWKRKIVRYLLCMVGVLIILPGLKVVLNKVNLYNPITAQLRYFATGFWVTIFPLVAKKLFPEHK